MLAYLQVRGFALIEHLEVELSPGLNILTGETGAGKSMFVDAVDVALGGRASSEYLRAGEETALVQAAFAVPRDSPARSLMAEAGMEPEEGELLVLEREINRSGRNVARVNGRLATVQLVRELAGQLCDLHGQHEHQSLLRPREQLELLDQFGGGDLLDLRQRLGAMHARLGSLRRRLGELGGDARDRAREMDLLQFQAGEIDSAELRAGEEEELKARRKVLGNIESLREGADFVLTLLAEGTGTGAPSLADLLGEAAGRLDELAAIDESLAGIHQAAAAAGYELEEAGRQLRSYRDRLDYDPEELRQVENRMALLTRLKRKFGDSVEDVMEYRRQLQRRIESLRDSEQSADEIKSEMDATQGEMRELAACLSQKRREAADRLESMVEDELTDLLMGGTSFRVSFERAGDESRDDPSTGDAVVQIGSLGYDRIEFMIAPNPGEPPMPLHRIASGGELARVMLALKRILAHLDRKPTLVFDEVDAGIGGKAGQAVARKMAHLARTHQVLCVTHLPQIAAMADAHYLMEKGDREGRTVTTMRRLEGEERTQEIARMLGGDVELEVARQHAGRLIEADQLWKEEIARSGQVQGG